MKKRNSFGMKLLIGLLVCACTLFLIGAGGQDRSGPASNSAANVNAPGVFPICKTPITLNAAIRMDNSVENYDTNAYTKLLEEKGNLKFNIEVYPSGNPGQERMLVQIAGGGTLPELMINFGFSQEVMLRLGTEGVAIRLNDYYGKWTYYFDQQIPKVTSIPNIIQLMHSADGNIYYIPYIHEQISENLSLRGWMNVQWLDNLGLKMPSTTAEFRTVLEAFRDRDPNRNGRRDEIPSAGATDGRARLHDFLINAFIYNDTRDRLLVTNGRVDTIANKPEYREGIRYVRDLMADGLILDTLFTINQTALRSVVEQETFSTIGFLTGGIAGIFSPTNINKLEYTAMAPLKGPQGVQYSPWMPQGPGASYVISKDCKNPEAAFRLGDYMCSEEASVWLRYGAPVRDWRAAMPGDKPLFDVGYPLLLKPILNWGSTQNSHWAQGAACILPQSIQFGLVAPDDPLDINVPIAAAVPLMQGLEPPHDRRVDFTVYTFQEVEALSDVRNSINTYVNENLALFITGQRNLEREWDAYVRELDRIGLARYLEITQSGYDRAIGKK